MWEANNVCCRPSQLRAVMSFAALLSNVWRRHLNYGFNISRAFTKPDTASLHAAYKQPHPGPRKRLRCQQPGLLRSFLLGFWGRAPFVSPRRYIMRFYMQLFSLLQNEFILFSLITARTPLSVWHLPAIFPLTP